MNRGMRDGGRSRMGSEDYGDTRGYSDVRGERFRGLLDSGVVGGGGYGGSGRYDSLIQQRSLQQRLSLRESQLALANSLLQQQQQQSYLMERPGVRMGGPGALGPGPGALGPGPGALGPGPGALGPGPMGMAPGGMMNKRRQDMRHGDYGPDFKRPRSDFSPRSRDRYRGRDSDDGNRSSNYRRNQSSFSSHSTSGKRESTDKYDPESPTADEEKDGDKKGKGKGPDPFHCHVCNIDCRDSDGFRRHMNSMRHNDRMMGLLTVHEEKSVQIASRMKAEKHIRHLEVEDRTTRGFCKICDMPLKVRYAEHQVLTFHKKRVNQVTKGCGWCGVTSFKNFTEVLAHRETEEHQKKQKEHENDVKDNRDSEHQGKATIKKRKPIRVEIPSELARYDSDTSYGQMCVIPVSGWFCKLCNKFYNNESAAKDSHCKTEDHYVKYKRFVYAKLRAKAEAEREAEETAEKEERKKKAEEGSADEEGEENGDDKDGSYEENEGEDEEAMEEEEEVLEGEDEEGGGEEEEDVMLATDGSAGEYVEEELEGSLLEDTKEASAYQTADDTVEADSTAELAEDGLTTEQSGISLLAGESGSELLTTSQEEEEDMTVADSLEGECDLSQEEDSLSGARTTRNTSTPIQGNKATNKARRGRKAAK